MAAVLTRTKPLVEERRDSSTVEVCLSLGRSPGPAPSTSRTLQLSPTRKMRDIEAELGEFSMEDGRGSLSPGNDEDGPWEPMPECNCEAEEEEESPETPADLEKVCTVGTGTFGRVYLVKRKATGEHLALKVMGLRDVVAMKQVEHVHSEKAILAQLFHPFLVRLHWAHRDAKALYLLFDFIAGGEMFSYLRSAKKFSASAGRFYTAEIISALEYLHHKNIVYRDLKPENIILDKDGHIRLTDFGFAKELTDRYPPFRGENAYQIYESILEGKIKFPKAFDLVAKDMIKKLLVSDRTRRLGNMKGACEDVKNHKWFRDIDWLDVYQMKLTPPVVPKVFFEGDAGNFDEYEEEELEDISEASAHDVQLFAEW